MTMRSRGGKGFTLIELLVVMAIIVMLTTLAVLVVPNMNDNRAAARAGEQVQSWLAGAKNRAIRDQAVRGIRLLSTQDEFVGGQINEQHVTQLQFIEQPEVFVPRATNGTFANAVLFRPTQPAPTYNYGNTNRGPNPATAYRTLTGTYVLRLSGLATSELNALRNMSANRSISLGDVAEINVGSSYRFRVEGIIPTATDANAVDIRLAPGHFMPGAGNNVNTGSFITRPGQLDPDATGYQPPGSTDATGDNVNETIPGTSPPQLVRRIRLTDGQLRVIRRPRAVVGEQNLEMPRGTLIDMTLSAPFQTSSSDVEFGTASGAPGARTNFYDILFGSNGQVVSSANSQRIVLWVRSQEDARWQWTPAIGSNSSFFTFNPAANAGFGSPTLIGISIRTGAIGSHPVDQNTTQVINTITRPRPYAFIEDNRGDSGL